MLGSVCVACGEATGGSTCLVFQSKHWVLTRGQEAKKERLSSLSFVLALFNVPLRCDCNAAGPSQNRAHRVIKDRRKNSLGQGTSQRRVTAQ